MPGTSLIWLWILKEGHLHYMALSRVTCVTQLC